MRRRAALASALLLLAACSEEPIEPTGAKAVPGALSAARTVRSGPAAPGPVLPVSECREAPAFQAAARANAETLRTAVWSAFGRPEPGWAVYAPLTAHEIGTACAADRSGFAAALAAWQRAQGLAPTGVLTAETLERLKAAWHDRRPFVAQLADGVCPPSPPEQALLSATPVEGYGGEVARLKPEALTAWRALVAAARAEAPEAFAADPEALKIFSSYRSPAEALERCGEWKCDGVARTWCSAHGTGLAVDVVVGAAPGRRVDSSEDANRLYMSGTPAYRWLVVNARRFGFVPYPFEPWHWEYAGSASAG